jgi:acyl-homoserine lactone acylase PvdQ
MGSVWFKLWRAAALGVLSADDLVKLRYDDGGADRLCIPPGADASRWVASLAGLREPIGALSLLAASAGTGGGSNNWALAPGRTATGRPILAGDPHRAFELPGMYAQMHLGCDQFDAIGLIPAGQMPRVDDPARGFIVTANNRVVTAIPDTGDYFCTDAHPPYRARRIEQLIAELAPASPQDMATIHRDDVSAPAQLFQAALADVAPRSAAARAVRDIMLGWDARMSPGSSGAACYSRLRWALAKIVAARSGLAAAGSAGLTLPGSVSAVSHLWWVLPALLRSGDLALTGGSTWDQLLAEALEEVSGEPPDIPWHQLHPAALTTR